jgi:hypothetical protein
MLLRYFVFFLLFGFGPGLFAQECNYQLLMRDAGGDGWNGDELTIRVNGVSTSYTLNFGNSDGDSLSVFFPVNDGDQVELDYTYGAFPEESSFDILNNNDSLIYAAGLMPDEGTNIASFTVACVACAPPPASSIEFFRRRSTSVNVRFLGLPAGEAPLYRVRFGGPDFNPATDGNGTTVTSPDTTFRINGLAPDSLFTFWIDAICRASNDTTAVRGPFRVRTLKRADVGVTLLAAPLSGCNLAAEDVTIGITNFGGEPQAFFNVDYSIDGQPAGVSTPDDGIFTGVVGVDSTEFFTFDTRAFLGVPGTYELKIWTLLEDDEVPANDTLTISVTHVPQIATFPYTENFEVTNGFWYPETPGLSDPSSWEWGAPDNVLIDRAPQGRNAWVTSLTTDYSFDENSFLLSPCFDLRDMEADPLFSCQLYVDTDDGFDGVSLEMTTDEGETWTRVETSPAGINWYNDLANQRWTGDGGFNGRFATVANLLDGAAGEIIQLRFAFRTAGFETAEGVLVDAVSIVERAARNLAAAQTTNLSTAACGSMTDSVVFRYTNLGTVAAENYTIGYRVNNGTVEEAMIAGPLGPGQTTTFTFTPPFDATVSGENRVEAWTDLDGDVQISNDTTVYFFRTRQDIPFFEGFSGGDLPAGWELNVNPLVGDRDGDGNEELYANLNENAPAFVVKTANYGLVEAGDSLKFQVSLDSFGTTGMNTEFLGPVFLKVRAFLNCNQLDTIVLDDIDLMGDSCIIIGLDDFADNSVQFEITTEWRSGDFWVAFDDVKIIRCPEDLALRANATATNTFGDNGRATIVPDAGLAPFAFAWDNGQNTSTVTGLAAGDYVITVTDAVGCTDVITVTIDINTSTDQATEVLDGLSVFPNPTAGALEIRLDLERTTRLGAEVYDLTGRMLRGIDFGRQTRLQERLDFSDLPAGIYLLRLRADDAARTIRVVKR